MNQSTHYQLSDELVCLLLSMPNSLQTAPKTIPLDQHVLVEPVILFPFVSNKAVKVLTAVEDKSVLPSSPKGFEGSVRPDGVFEQWILKSVGATAILSYDGVFDGFSQLLKCLG